MITTVTTTTTAIVTTLTATSLTLIVILTLIGLLIQKEIVSGLSGPKARRLSRALNVAIVPLAIVFIATALYSVIDVLN